MHSGHILTANLQKYPHILRFHHIYPQIFTIKNKFK